MRWTWNTGCSTTATILKSTSKRSARDECSSRAGGAGLHGRIHRMNRYECLQVLVPLIADHLIVTTQSGQRIEWGSLSSHEGNLLLGEMGAALSVGAGLAAALPNRPVVVLESDGSVLLSLSSLATVANLGIHNLAVFVFDNGTYSGTRISEPTATRGKTDLEQVAKGAGIERSATVRDLESFKKEAVLAIQ